MLTSYLIYTKDTAAMAAFYHDSTDINNKEQRNLRKIESLEQKLINNLDENSYSELIKLKSQLNRE